MDDLRELYQATILGHNKKPRNFRVIEDSSHEADGHNPLCGDQLTLYARITDDGTLEDVSFQGSGCAISKASASLINSYVLRVSPVAGFIVVIWDIDCFLAFGRSRERGSLALRQVASSAM